MIIQPPLIKNDRGGLQFLMRTAIFKAKFENLDAIREYLSQAAKDHGVDEEGIYTIQLAGDEACSNIIEHAYKGTPDGEIECTVTKDGENLILIIKDHGCCFDPASVPEPKLNSPIEERDIGGLGLYLIRHLMDEVNYESLGTAGNVLTLKKHIFQKK